MWDSMEWTDEEEEKVDTTFKVDTDLDPEGTKQLMFHGHNVDSPNKAQKLYEL